jgi:hypothetical protein
VNRRRDQRAGNHQCGGDSKEFHNELLKIGLIEIDNRDHHDSAITTTARSKSQPSARQLNATVAFYRFAFGDTREAVKEPRDNRVITRRSFVGTCFTLSRREHWIGITIFYVHLSR